ncbi:four-carbon acid sugar kinase family protein [Pseudonocardia spirodelae]|uniref:Four-carbon acid sugar kinase family protein n=1 Tax=Pseudonocardia spirodelae TaxID=3133431 RepID=A0ABU8T1I5_9PSEU
MSGPVVGFFADDLTGASDVLVQAHGGGLSAALVLDPAGGLPDTDVVGVAGTARSLAGDELDAAVRAGVAPLVAAAPQVLLYKVCSTFDSSATVGSIGRGIELLHEAVPGHGPVPVAPAQPSAGRHTAFGNHFGRSGDAVHRLDRHPVMSRHPVTPMHEADLRRVLAGQLTGAPDVALLDLPGHAGFDGHWARLRAGHGPAFVVDAVTDEDLDRVAAALLADPAAPSLVVGSGGIMAALARRRGSGAPPGDGDRGATGPVLAVSASASAVTGDQIDDALGRGWTGVPVPAGAGQQDAEARAGDAVTAALRRGEDVVAYTVRGPDDPALRHDGADPAATGARIGRLAAAAVTGGLTGDVVVCGGDTSGHALVAMGARELRVVAPFVPLAPVCRVTDGPQALTGCRLVLKGGQAGPPDVLHRFAAGRPR